MSDRRIPEPRMRDEFRRELRARLMSEAQRILVPKRRENVWTWLRPALAVGMAALVLFAGAGTAAAGSLPGDPAFGLKRAIEDIQVALTFDDVEKVKLLAELTDKRLEELQQVADRSDKAPTASEEYAQAVVRFRSALEAFREAAPEDKREKAQEVADAARDKHEPIVDELRDRVPEKAKPALERARNEERKDAPERGKDHKKIERLNQSPDPARSSRPAGPSTRPAATPRETERPETPRPPTQGPTGTPRPTERG